MDPGHGLPKRRSPRHPTFDYSAPGWYLVTVCTWRQCCTLGRIEGGVFVPSALGTVVTTEFTRIPGRHPGAILEESVVMPNHVHAVIQLGFNADATRTVTLGAVVGTFKGSASYHAAQLASAPTGRLWQRGYHDVILPTERAFIDACAYVRSNPRNWPEDRWYRREEPR